VIAYSLEGTRTGAVGLSVRAFEDKLYWPISSQRGKMIGNTKEQITRFNNAWSGNDKQTFRV
jgi:hypothetical protein